MNDLERWGVVGQEALACAKLGKNLQGLWMRKIIGFGLVFLCLILIPKNQAQNQPNGFSLGEGWIYQEQCLSEPVPPPIDWSWGGTIMLNGPYGIHGIHRNWESPRVLGFIQENAFVESLSPDGMWMVGVIGDRECGRSMGCGYTYNYAQVLQIYYLASDQSRYAYSIPWNFTELSRHTLSDAARPTWISNQEFVYGGQASGEQFRNLGVVNVETRLVSEWNGRDDILAPSINSPDLSRGFDYEALIDLETGEVLGSLDEADRNIMIYSDDAEDLWSPSSEYFLALEELDDSKSRLLLYNREGQSLGHILTATRLGSGMFDPIEWSPSGQKFLFHFWIEVENGLTYSTTHVIDIENQSITNLCEELNAAWSPDGEYIALNWNSQISVLDSQFNHYLIREQASGYGVYHWRQAE